MADRWRRIYKYTSSYLLIFSLPFVALSLTLYIQTTASVAELTKAQHRERLTGAVSALSAEIDNLTVSIMALSGDINGNLYPTLMPRSLRTVEGRRDIRKTLSQTLAQNQYLSGLAIVYESSPDTAYTDGGSIAVTTTRSALSSSPFAGFDFASFAGETFDGGYRFATCQSGSERALYFVYNVKAAMGNSRQIVARISTARLKRAIAAALGDLPCGVALKLDGEEIFSVSYGGFAADGDIGEYALDVGALGLSLSARIESIDQPARVLARSSALLITVSGVFILGLGAVAVVSATHYNPIARMQAAIKEAQEENVSLHDTLRRNGPLVENQLVFELLKGRMTPRGVLGGEDDVRSDGLRTLLDMDEWRVLILGLGGSDLDFGAVRALQNSFAEPLASAGFACYQLETVSGDMAIILGGDEGSLQLDNAMTLIGTLRSILRAQLRIEVGAGVGSLVRCADEMRLSFSRARQALDAALARDSTCVVRAWEELAASDAPQTPSCDADGEDELIKAKMLEYIGENIGAPTFGRASIADALGMTDKQFTRFFKLTMGMSFREYIFDYRIQRACALLSDTDEPIAAVMRAVGYNDISNFTRTFRVATGATPGRYRELHRAG